MRLRYTCLLMSKAALQPDKFTCMQAAKACACFNLRKASRAVSRLFDETLQPIGLRSTQFITILAIRIDQPIVLAALAKELVTDRSTLTRNLAILQKNGLIETSSPNGKRSRAYLLTDKGTRALTEGIPLWEKAQGRFIDVLGADEWSDMLALLSKTTIAAQRL